MVFRSTADIPDQSGSTALVTGANTGVGFETAKALAERGAHVILACRDPRKAEQAAALIGPAAAVVPLDLTSPDSIRAAAHHVRTEHPPLDLLVNNAAVMEQPAELTFTTNHLGPFAFTGLLADHLRPGARIVTVSSVAHKRGTPHFDDLAGTSPGDAYAWSKLANLLFTYELDRRLAERGAVALAAHPGIVDTALWRTSSGMERFLVSRRLRAVNFWFSQGPDRGALPVLRAATDPAATGSQFYGPGGPFEATGAPVLVKSSPRSQDTALQQRLWEFSARETGVAYR